MDCPEPHTRTPSSGKYRKTNRLLAPSKRAEFPETSNCAVGHKLKARYVGLRTVIAFPTAHAGPKLIRKASSMEMQLTGNGRRWSRRIAVDIPIQVLADGSPIVHGHLKDLSLSGALVITDRPLPLRTYIEITFQPLETAHGAERVMARVTRNVEGGVGVEWCEFAPSAVTDLLRSPSY
jgi:hypothetical protein